MKHSIKSISLVLSLCLLTILPVKAEYWQTKVDAKKADFIMQEMKFPYFVSPTYYAFLQGAIAGESRKQRVSFYGGLAHNMQQTDNYYYNCEHLWTFWPTSPDNLSVAPIWAAPGFKPSVHVGEGAAGRIGGRTYPIKVNSWYRHVRKIWSPTDPEKAKKISYAGWWIKDLDEKNEWTLLAVFEVPIPNAHFEQPALSGFIERMAGPQTIRAQSFRNLYTAYQNKWSSCDFQTFPKKIEFHKLDYDPAEKSVTFEFTDKPFEGSYPGSEQKTVDLKQAPKPQLAQPKLAEVTAFSHGEVISVSWQTDSDSSPQLRAKIKILDENGEALKNQTVDLPYVSDALIQLPKDQASLATKVQVTLIDPFDQTTQAEADISRSSERVHSFKNGTLENARPGLLIEYYELKNGAPRPANDKAFANWGQLPSLDSPTLELKRRVFQKNLDLTLRTRDFASAARVSSFVKIPKSGLYHLYLKASNGGVLKMHDTVVVSQNQHRSSNFTHQSVILEKGLHPISIELYWDAQANGVDNNSPEIALEIEGPGLTRQALSGTDFYLDPQQISTASVEISTQLGSGIKSNQVAFQIDQLTDPKNEIERITITSANGEEWINFDGEIAQGSSLTAFMPEYRYTLYPRLYLKGGTIVELDPFTVHPKNPPFKGPWSLAPLLRPVAVRPIGYQTEQDRVAIIGDELRWINQKVSGDFTFQMRVHQFKNAIGPPIHTAYAGFGFIASASEKRPPFKTITWNYTPYFQGRYETPKNHHGGLHQENWSKSGHGIKLPCQFRFTRKGNRFKGEVRNQGEAEFKVLFDDELDLPQELYIGPHTFQQGKQDSKMFYTTEFDQIELRQAQGDKR